MATLVVLSLAAPPTAYQFIHIPKCGTSFILTLRNALAACTDEKDCVCSHGSNHSMKLPTYSCQSYTDDTCGGALIACQRWKFANTRTWHMPLGANPRPRIHQYSVVTMVREPVSLVISLLMHSVPKYAQRLSILREGMRSVGALEAAVKWYRECCTAQHAMNSSSVYGIAAPKACSSHMVRDLQSYFLLAMQQQKDSGDAGLQALRAMPRARFVEHGRQLVSDSFQFVGITGQWQASMCLFYASVLGRSYDGSGRSHDESISLVNVRPGAGAANISNASASCLAGLNALDRTLYHRVLFPMWRRKVAMSGCQRWVLPEPTTSSAAPAAVSGRVC